MRFVVKKEIFEELPSACFGVVMAKGIEIITHAHSLRVQNQTEFLMCHKVT